jgi:hypothetical protein
MNCSAFAKFAAALVILPKNEVSSFNMTVDHKDKIGFTVYTVSDTTDIFYPYAVSAKVFHADADADVELIEVAACTTELDAIEAIKDHKTTY